MSDKGSVEIRNKKIVSMYVGNPKKFSGERLSKQFSISKATISLILINAGIRRHTKEKTGYYREVTLSVRFSVFSRDCFTCVYCGKSSPDVKLHIDHLIPKSKNGSNKIENLVTACEECNIGKGDKILNEKNYKKINENISLSK